LGHIKSIDGGNLRLPGIVRPTLSGRDTLWRRLVAGAGRMAVTEASGNAPAPGEAPSTQIAAPEVKLGARLQYL
jgi:hypothetical protein